MPTVLEGYEPTALPALHPRRGPAEMRAALERDLTRARARPEYGRIGKSGRLVMQIDTVAAMNAVDAEGPDVLTAAGDEYWRDMRRRHPWIDTMPDRGAVSVRAMRNRHGRVAWRKVY